MKDENITINITNITIFSSKIQRIMYQILIDGVFDRHNV